MRKLRLKKGAMVGAYLIAFGLTGMGAFFVSENMKESTPQEENIDYVNQSIIDHTNEEIEVINQNQSTTMIKPYVDDQVVVAKYYYDYQDDNTTQEKSILYHENTYIQNTGMDFTKDDSFDVVAVLDGTVTDVKEDELLGTIVEIKHDGNFISSYQSLSEVTVKKNDTVSQGQVIGKSGTNELDKDLGNHLHFELYQNGQVLDPSDYFDKEITVTTTDDTKTDESQETGE